MYSLQNANFIKIEFQQKSQHVFRAFLEEQESFHLFLPCLEVEFETQLRCQRTNQQLHKNRFDLHSKAISNYQQEVRR